MELLSIMSSKDISIEDVKLTVPNKTLLENTKLKIAYGHKYGLIGYNGCGKSTLLNHVAKRKFNIPENIDIYCVKQEEFSDPNKSVFETVISANRKRLKLVKKYDALEKQLEETDSIEELMEEMGEIMDKLDQIDAYKDESIIRKILYGIGFSKEEQDLPTSSFSGGWRMRISLAKALYMNPVLLLMDEPTNHLDLNAVIWLTDYLKQWKKTLVIVSHSRNFLNEICTDIIHLSNKQLDYYVGGYDKFTKGLAMKMRTMEKEWNKVLTKARMMRKKSELRGKVNKFLLDNNDKKPKKPYKVNLDFGDIPYTDSCLIEASEISFGYNDNYQDNLIYDDIDLDVYMGNRITIVGKNGAGKSTLLKILAGHIKPTSGQININGSAEIGYFHQHSYDVLPLNCNAVEYLLSLDRNLTVQDARKILGTIGMEGNLHLQKIDSLSGGQKSRVAFASLFVMKPNVILLDEPTNHLDMETISALIDGINNYPGAVVLVTHDIDLIEETECILLKVEDQKLIKTDFDTYYSEILEEIENKN